MNTTVKENLVALVPKRKHKMEGCPIGRRINDPNAKVFRVRDYWLPGDMRKGAPAVSVRRDKIRELVLKGADWSKIENLLLVSQTHLKELWTNTYNQALAEYQILLLQSMTKAAVIDGNATMLKWLSSNYLGFSDSSKPEPSEEQMTEDMINAKLKSIFDRKT